MTRYLLAVLVLCAFARTAFAASDIPADPTSLASWVEVVAKFGLAPTGFGAIVYWLVRYHIPSLQATFTDGLKVVVEDHKQTRKEDREYHEAQVGAIKDAMKNEGEANRSHREAMNRELRATLTGLSSRSLREARDAEDEAPPKRRASTG